VIDKIIYINLDSRQDRRDWLEAQLASIDIPFERFSAIAPTLESIKNKDGQYHDFYTRLALTGQSSRWEIGTIGCYLSHLSIHKMAQEKIFGNYIILEDDCRISQESIETIKEKINDGSIGDDWDMVRSTWFSHSTEIFKYDYCPPMSKFYKESYKDNLERRADYLHSKYGKWIHPSKKKQKINVALCGGTHFQLIKKSSTPKIIKYLNEDHVFPIDTSYTTNVLNVYDCNFGIKPKGSFASDIH
jgi:GR25 family glycosyltransferase involved in LPS biosynthesis